MVLCEMKIPFLGAHTHKDELKVYVWIMLMYLICINFGLNYQGLNLLYTVKIYQSDMIFSMVGSILWCSEKYFFEFLMRCINMQIRSHD